MKSPFPSLPTLWLAALAAAIPAAAIAHGGEDHGAAPAPMTQAVLPRTEAATELFELVGVLEAGRLVIYLDAQASNSPVEKAVVEVEGAGLNAKAVETSPGVYTVAFKQPLPAGRHALNFTVQAGENADLLAAALQVDAQVAAAQPAAAPRWGSWLAGAGVLGAAGIGAVVFRRRRSEAADTDVRNAA